MAFKKKIFHQNVNYYVLLANSFTPLHEFVVLVFLFYDKSFHLWLRGRNIYEWLLPAKDHTVQNKT